MPKVEVEILRTTTITRDESVVVELDVPQRVLDDDGVLSWISEIMDKDDDGTLTQTDRDVYATLAEAEWDVHDEGESFEYTEVYAD